MFSYFLSSLILNQSMKLAKYFMLVTASWACKMHHFLYHIKAYGLNSKNRFISKEADCFLLDQHKEIDYNSLFFSEEVKWMYAQSDILKMQISLKFRRHLLGDDYYLILLFGSKI